MNTDYQDGIRCHKLNGALETLQVFLMELADEWIELETNRIDTN